MFKKILIGVALVGLIGALVVGAVIRTTGTTGVAEARGQGQGRSEQAGSYEGQPADQGCGRQADSYEGQPAGQGRGGQAGSYEDQPAGQQRGGRWGQAGQ